jgi:hypothetical protein
LGIVVLAMVAACVLESVLWMRNRMRKAMSEDEIREKYSQVQLDAMGDKSPLFYYTL